jgi:hypothetical protein
LQTNQVDVTGPAIADLGEGCRYFALHPLHISNGFNFLPAISSLRINRPDIMLLLLRLNTPVLDIALMLR